MRWLNWWFMWPWEINRKCNERESVTRPSESVKNAEFCLVRGNVGVLKRNNIFPRKREVLPKGWNGKMTKRSVCMTRYTVIKLVGNWRYQNNPATLENSSLCSVFVFRQWKSHSAWYERGIEFWSHHPASRASLLAGCWAIRFDRNRN